MKNKKFSYIDTLPAFKNEPLANFAKNKDEFQKFLSAIRSVRSQLGKKYPLYIDNEEVFTNTTFQSVNPNNPSEIIGNLTNVDLSNVSAAIAAAKNAFPAWRNTSAQERAHYLLEVAKVARSRIYELSAWQILEVGKQWDQAYADVCEAIDFLEYYARETLRLAEPRQLESIPGELNTYFYEPRGIAVVIAPWNFPLAISLGMVAAAIVTGNTVIYKPSELSPVVGFNLTQLFRPVGLPSGVFNYLTGDGPTIGGALVEHPDVSLIAFTGSKKTGLHICQKAATLYPNQPYVKRVICEMGGKNAIIVDETADIDEAIPSILHSAFAYQGQKCSACSRLIVLDAVYDQCVSRLVETAKTLTIGPSEDPSNFFGALIDKKAQEKVTSYIEIGKKEASLLYQSPTPEIPGFFVPLTIFNNALPSHRIAQEEVFGPLLVILRAKNFSHAIDLANSTEFALTGSVFSRTPSHLQKASQEFRVGNLYLNRGCTGAIVGRQPFGGFRMSGGGTKAGGPDYLLHFLDPRTVTENTLRRGFQGNSSFSFTTN